MTTIVKATTKGQVTLPSKWRKNFKTDRFLIKQKGNSLVITPVEMDDLDESAWETIFDAERDNKGKTIPISKLIRVLKKTLK